MADPKSNRLKARLPRGLADRGPAEIAATRRMTETIRKVYELYGFESVETPAIEYTDALGKFLPDQDRPNEGVFSFQDDDEQWLSLRYDLTAPLARYVAENFDTLPKPYRSYRAGYVYRNEKPGPGRFRQFMQFDADTVGSASMAADAEICMMAADTMEALGLGGHYVVKVNNRKVLDGVLEFIGLGGEEHAGRRLTVLRALDKYDRLGKKAVGELLGAGRTDESGDRTAGAGLDLEQINLVLWFLTLRSEPHGIVEFTKDWFNPHITLLSSGGEPHETNLLDAFGRAYGSNKRFHEGVEEFREIGKLVEAAGYDKGKIIVDPSVVRGLEYYTGPVYEVELTLPIVGDGGKPVRFGSVGGGGRYDGLVSRFRGESVPATGFSIGVSRLLAALMQIGKIDSKPERGPVIVTVFDKDRLADYQHMASRLRQAGIRAELYLGSGKFGQQMKYADRRRTVCVVIQGTDEKQKGEVQIKDLIVGAELAGLSKERDDYLKKQAEAQHTVPEEKLVDAVHEVLARHGVAKHVSHPNQTMFADLIGQEFLDYIFETAPRKVGSRVRKSLDHFCKGASLEGIDDEMGAIRLIAAEEELVVAIFEWLKLNADKMPEHADFVRKYKNHNVKLAFHPVLSQFWNALGYMFSDGLTLEGLEEYLYWTPRPILHDNKLLLQFIDNDGKEFIKQNPLAIKVSRSDLSDEEVIEEMFKDFAKLIQDQQKMTVSEFISIRADYRNKLLYASDAGYVAMDDSLKDLIEIFKSTYRDLLWTLATLLGNSPPGKGFGLVSQFIALYRRVLVEARLI